MSERDRGLRSVLALPSAFGLLRRVVWSDGSNRRFVTRYIRPRDGDRVLDVGCGPGHILAYLPRVVYRGIDMSEPYIRAAQHHWRERGTFVCARVGADTLCDHGTYDIVLAIDVLHHLADEEAVHLLRLAHTALRPGGRLITKDGCYVEGQSIVARYLLSKDRGRYVRTEAQYRALVAQVFSRMTGELRHDLLRIPYTHLVLECTKGSAAE